MNGSERTPKRFPERLTVQLSPEASADLRKCADSARRLDAARHLQLLRDLDLHKMEERLRFDGEDFLADFPADMTDEVLHVGRGTQSSEAPKYVPAVPISASELQATTVAEFLGLLRELMKRSGVNRKQLHERSGVPKSTVYHWADPKTVALPSKPEQVRELAVACGLTKDQVDRIMQLWSGLRMPAVVLPEPEVEPEGEPNSTGTATEVETAKSASYRRYRNVDSGMYRHRFGRSARWWTFGSPEFGMMAISVMAVIMTTVLTWVNRRKMVGLEAEKSSFLADFISASVVPLAIAMVTSLGLLAIRRRDADKPKITLLRQSMRDKAIRTLERHEFRSGRIMMVQRVVYPDGRVDLSTIEE
jgi:hypothetical protein